MSSGRESQSLNEGNIGSGGNDGAKLLVMSGIYYVPRSEKAPKLTPAEEASAIQVVPKQPDQAPVQFAGKTPLPSTRKGKTRKPITHWTLSELEFLMEIIEEKLCKHRRLLQKEDWVEITDEMNKHFQGQRVRAGDKLSTYGKFAENNRAYPVRNANAVHSYATKKNTKGPLYNELCHKYLTGGGKRFTGTNIAGGKGTWAGKTPLVDDTGSGEDGEWQDDEDN
ncbi:uncharacterized protein LY89DRAFT_735935 [Mollisia scopiformis]|uniref:Uncharacterized protein n=1 Tax=Mollisia scopiformis TaxID=149040 RepID=A0A194X3V8_MOLSC|nr:uncharacterized protein LY89DRAFT_735935 [Mollisia scopiformis]KUJ14873.1 hypothetical protein LY89DRAFT_735935 [Mollisia scopiformis]